VSRERISIPVGGKGRENLSVEWLDFAPEIPALHANRRVKLLHKSGKISSKKGTKNI